MELKKTMVVLAGVFLIMLLMTACTTDSQPAQTPEVTEHITKTVVTAEPATPSPAPTATSTPAPTPRSGPTVIGIYKADSGGRVLQSLHASRWTRGKDIAIFNAFASNEPVLDYAAYRQMLVDCWFSFPNAIDYKIGYTLSYTLFTGEKFCVNIRKPSDMIHTEYLEVYLYDSVQQYARSGHYTHLSDEDMDDETLLYSFKLTPGVKIEEVDTIKLKAYIYRYNDESDFDPDTGEYIGTVSYDIDIIRVD